MGGPPLAVAVVWHMHQPWYRDDVAGRFVLPWVRRRASKDYLHMLRILERHPEVRVSMNMVPSLLAQVELYARGDDADADRELCLRDAAELTPAERAFLVTSARHDDHGRRVALLAPYMALLDRLGAADPAGAATADIRDLQLWALLAWIDTADILADPALAGLAQRGHGFTEDDKRLVDERQLALLRQVIPAFRDAVASGRVEPLTTPYHHPILPLLIDAACARVASPAVRLPEPPLQAGADAEEQVRSGLAVFAQLTGHGAAGMWPAECAVSPAAAALMRSCGVRFAVSDEGVLARTLDRDDVRSGGELYAAHAEASGLVMVFRDAQLSNLVGFTYQSLDAGAAAADLLRRLEELAVAQPPTGPQRLVTIALDGENFKDFYAENGTPFLDAFYTGLAASATLQSTHVGAYLDSCAAPPAPLPRLWTGSWIDADLRTWIGDDAHTRAWTLLAGALDSVRLAGGADAHPLAHHELLVAEASDWFWWFGEHHTSGSDAAWDELFRTHLRNAYALAGLAIPEALSRPILEGGSGVAPGCPPLRSVDPDRHGESEWGSAGIAEVGAALGSMRPPASSVARIRYGAGGGRLHILFGDSPPRFDRAVVDAGAAGRLTLGRPVQSVAMPLDAPVVEFCVTLEESGRGVERVPASGTLHAEDRTERAGPPPARTLIVAAECAPVVVAGGLGPRVAATAAGAAARGDEVVVVVPGHRAVLGSLYGGLRLPVLACPAWGRTLSARVLQAALPGGVPLLVVDAPGYFDRAVVYGAADDGERYLAFCALVVALLDSTGFAPDVVHGFEWQTAGLLAVVAARPNGPATVLSIGAGSSGHRVPRSAAAGVGAIGIGDGDMDLLGLGRRSATVIDEGATGVSAHDLHEQARRRHGGQR